MWMNRGGGLWEVGSSMGGRGRLHVYLGAAAGVGKTYAMLVEARGLAGSRVDVVVGLVETHDRGDTEQMLDALEQVPRRQVGYRGSTFGELDVGAVLNRRPTAVVVDELAHTCVPGSRHEKRWEDVEEFLDAGIDVITSLNVQHLDSLNDSVESLTGFAEPETVPDAVVAAADRVELIDVSPQLLRERITNTDVLGSGATADVALSGFFTTDRLAALRALALGWLGQHDLLDPVGNPVADDTTSVPVRPERIVVALTGAPEGEHVLRRATQIAAATSAVLIGVYVHEPSGLTEAEPAWLGRQRQLLSELGGRYVELAGIDVATTLLDFARTEDARQLVLGATRRSRLQELLHGSVINKAIRTAGSIEVSVIPPRRRVAHVGPAKVAAPPPTRRVTFPGQRRAAAWALAVVAPLVVTIGLVPLRASLGLAGELLCALLSMVGVALLGGIRPALLATGVSVLASDYLYAPPLYSFQIASVVDLVALITFVAVAAVVGGLVDLLTRQGVRVARADAEAANLARLAADLVATPPGLAETIGSLRSTFDLDAVAVLRRTEHGWEVEAAAGQIRLDSPERAAYSVELDRDRVLALDGTRLTDQNNPLLRGFLDQLRFARERATLQTLGDTEDPPSVPS
jgi:two-component system sensor histidine kinase KdpD